VKVAAYSAIFGEYDQPKVIPADFGAPAIMFTESDKTARLAVEAGWRVVRSTANSDLSPMMRHKWFKLHPHLAFKNADVTLWLDGSMTPYECYVEKCLTALGDDDWVMVQHPSRNCIYDEASYSATLHWRYDGPAILAQAEFYRGLGHPAGWGLFATGANVRRHTHDVARVCENWWWENTERSHQDQVSLPVLVRLEGSALRWNLNMPWHEWWHLAEHGS
jgi:alkaline ceramidase TOD1/glycosyltransferase MUCI70-like protein